MTPLVLLAASKSVQAGPSTLELVALVLGALGSVLGLVLGGLRLRDHFREKPDLRLDFLWQYVGQDPDDPTEERELNELRVFVSNLGRRKDTVREIGFALDCESLPYYAASIRDQLPIVLEPNVVAKFIVGIHPQHDHPVHRRLHQWFGGGEMKWAFIVTSDRKQHWFPIPSPQLGELQIPP